MKKWQIENSEISKILVRVFLFPSFRFCTRVKIENSDLKISENFFRDFRGFGVFDQVSLCYHVEKNEARCNQNDVVIEFSDVIDIDYNEIVSFGFHQKCFLVLKVRIMESFYPKGHEN